MKRRSERLHQVHRLSELEEQEHSREMGRLERRLQDEIRRLEELQTYRNDYRCRNSARFDSAQWKEYQNFLQRLDEAVRLQARLVQERRQQCDECRVGWLARRRKRQSLERVVHRLQSEERAERERALQGVDDETAQNVSSPLVR